MVFTLLAYATGAALGLLAERGGPRLRRDWPIYLRLQFVATAALLGLVAAWRLSDPLQAVPSIAITGVSVAIMAAALLTRRGQSTGLVFLEAWSAYPNGAFWVLPFAGALVGTSASAVAAISNSLYAVPNAVSIHFMRRDAPHPQRVATSWVDQSALGALVLGLFLHLAGPAPAWTHWVLVVSGPLLAFVGAALFTGSVLHPHNVGTGRTSSGLRRWMFLSAVRVAWLLPIAVLTRSRAVAVVAVLSALGAPAFNPAQLAVLYRYRTATVNVAARWGWVLLPVGLGVATAFL
jgi:hypothetical protein